MTDAAATQASRPVYTDMRFVVDAAAPGSLDAYDQEVGRGRTGRRPAAVELPRHSRGFDLQRSPPRRATAGPGRPPSRRAPQPTDISVDAKLIGARRTTALNLLEQADAVVADEHGQAWRHPEVDHLMRAPAAGEPAGRPAGTAPRVKFARGGPRSRARTA
jgi:ATP-dependent DNA helicase RecQ